LGFLLYVMTANTATWSTMGRVFFPNAVWIILVLWGLIAGLHYFGVRTFHHSEIFARGRDLASLFASKKNFIDKLIGLYYTIH
jgi:hypothetical protein